MKVFKLPESDEEIAALTPQEAYDMVHGMDELLSTMLIAKTTRGDTSFEIQAEGRDGATVQLQVELTLIQGKESLANVKALSDEATKRHMQGKKDKDAGWGVNQ